MSTETPPAYVVLRTCTADRYGPEIQNSRPDTLEGAREWAGHWRETARAGGRGCCTYDLMRLAPEHLLPLLDLTADELTALCEAAKLTTLSDRIAFGIDDAHLRSALDKLTTTDTTEETS